MEWELGKVKPTKELKMSATKSSFRSKFRARKEKRKTKTKTQITKNRTILRWKGTSMGTCIPNKNREKTKMPSPNQQTSRWGRLTTKKESKT